MGNYDKYVISTWELCWYILIMILGVLGNVFVLIVSFRSKSVSRSAPFNVYVTSLALVDLLISLLVVPMYILSTDLTTRLVMYFFTFWFAHASMYLLVAICIERRKAILYPFTTLRKQTFTKTILVVFFMLLLGFLNEVPFIYGLFHKTEKATKLTLHMVASALEIFIPLIVFIVSFIQIQICLTQREKDLGEFLNKYKHEKTYRKVKTSNQMQSKKSTIHTMQLVILTFFLCILPNEMLYVLLQYFNFTELEWGSPVYQVGILLRLSNSCLNPIVYSCRSQLFRKHFKEVFKPPVSCSSENLIERMRNTNFNYSRLSSDSVSSNNARKVVL